MWCHWQPSRRNDTPRRRPPTRRPECLESRQLLSLVVFDVNATEGVALPSGSEIASFSASDLPGTQSSDYTASINWGDGQPNTTGNVIAGGPGFEVLASHTYLVPTSPASPYPITVSVMNQTPTTITATGVANVASVALTSSAVNIDVNKGTAFTMQVAEFMNANTSAFTTSFKASINWGDGTAPSSGMISSIPGPSGFATFAVVGSHTYAQPGSFPVVTTISNADGQAAIATGTATVPSATPVIVPTGLLLTTAQNTAVPSSTVVGAFTCTQTPVPDSSSFTAVINWGDGQTTAGSVVGTGTSGDFDVKGGHTYSLPGSYSVNIKVQDQLGDMATIMSTLVVTPLAPAVFAGPNFAVTAGVPFSRPVVTFTDPNPLASASNITAVISWGDGQVSNGMITGPDSNGLFTVNGSHTYAFNRPSVPPPTYPVTVTISDPSGLTATASGKIEATTPTISASGVTFAVTPGVPFTGVVATFTDANPLAANALPVAQIAWGDGHTSQGTVSGPDANGVFTVTGTNTYASGPGPFKVMINITDPNGITGAATSTAVVSQLGIAAAPTSFAVTPGVAFTATVATFTDNNPLANKGNITAVINWGDGGFSAGTISGPDSGGVYTVTGNYSYSYGSGNGQNNGYNNQILAPQMNAAGTKFYNVTVMITGPGGEQPSGPVTSTAVITPPVATNIPFTGGLASVGNGPDAGLGRSNTNRPTFSGTATPFAIVQIFARLLGVDATEPLGQAIADANGNWSLDTGPLARGKYTVTAIVTPPGGSPSPQMLLEAGNPVYIRIPLKAPRPHRHAKPKHEKHG
jgi:hypothetical protein